MKPEDKEQKELKISERRSYKIYKANEIIRKARYSLNVTELKILAFCFSMIKPTDLPDTWYSFTCRELCEICNISLNSLGMYSRIKELIKGLRDKSFWLAQPDGSEETIGWIDKAIIQTGTGRIRIKFDGALQKYIIGLKENYTQYELLAVLPMKHASSYRIYELLRSYVFKKQSIITDADKNTEITFNLKQFRKKLGYDSQAYDQFKAFRRRCLEPAIVEINLYTDIQVSYSTVMIGRKVDSLCFTIQLKDDVGIYTSMLNAEEQLMKPKEDFETGQMHITDYEDYLPEKGQ